jgi:Uma2 family endonuclease
MSVTAPNPPQLYRWTRDDYQKMADTGIFSPDARVELIEGKIVEMSPQNTQHAAVVTQADKVLTDIFEGYTIRIQCPFAIGSISEPEPDVAVVQGKPFDYLNHHPSSAALIVEISDSSLIYDQTTKASLYGRAGILDYWILNLIDHQLEVYRNPQKIEDQEFGYGYTDMVVYTSNDHIAPLALSNQSVQIADLLP